MWGELLHCSNRRADVGAQPSPGLDLLQRPSDREQLEQRAAMCTELLPESVQTTSGQLGSSDQC